MKKSHTAKKLAIKKKSFSSFAPILITIALLIGSAWYIFSHILTQSAPAPSHAPKAILEMAELNVIPGPIISAAKNNPASLTMHEFTLAVRMSFVDCLRRAEIIKQAYDQLNIKGCSVAASEFKNIAS